MSLDKAILYGKERRNPYRGAKAIDPTCRNHGNDDWERSNRQFQQKKSELCARSKMKDFEEGK